MDGIPMSIKQTVQEMTKTGNGAVMEAKVISVSPLKVQATNDEKLVLSMATLTVPRHLTDYSTTATFSLDKGSIASDTEGAGTHAHANGSHGGHTGGSGEHTHSGDGAHPHHLVSFALTRGTLIVHNALTIGEYVYLLPYNDGKKYYILDRRSESADL